MSSIKLFPAPKSLKFGIAGGVMLFLMGHFMSGVSSGFFAQSVFVMLRIFGVFAIVRCAWWLKEPTPCFEADAEGFSVMGKAQRPWSDFHSAEVHTVSMYGFVPISRWVVIRSGKSRLMAKKFNIGRAFLPGSAKGTVQEIVNIAVAVQNGIPMAVRQPEMPNIAASVEPVIADAAATPPPFIRPSSAQPHSLATSRSLSQDEANLRDAFRGTGPVKSTGGRGRGLFGRKVNVI